MFRGTPRFADMYYTFAVLDCNKTGCGFENNYGPLWEYLAINININVASYVSSIILIFITQVFFYNLMMKSLAKGMLIFFVYISPPTAFLFERMNFDVIFNKKVISCLEFTMEFQFNLLIYLKKNILNYIRSFMLEFNIYKLED